MGIEMIKMVEKGPDNKPIWFTPVDEWDTEENPISEQDRIFKNIRGEIILPISEYFCKDGDEEKRSLDYFVMTKKRSYNSDEIELIFADTLIILRNIMTMIKNY